MPLTRDETLEVFYDVAATADRHQAKTWAQGMTDALDVLARFPQDEAAARQFAEAAAKL